MSAPGLAEGCLSLHCRVSRFDAEATWRTHISLDEWSLGPPWSTEAWGVPQALYGASFIALLVRQASPLGIASANYYAPINEGAVAVQAGNATLTPLGEVLAL